MKRIVLAGLLLGILVIAGAALAESGTTTLVGTSAWPDNRTTAVQGTFGGRLGQGSYSGTLVEGDLLPPGTECGGPGCVTVTGNLTFTSTRGDFTATVSPASVATNDGTPTASTRLFRLRLQLVSGTRSYSHAHGTLSLQYVSTRFTFFDPNAPPDFFVRTFVDRGTLSGNPHGR